MEEGSIPVGIDLGTTYSCVAAVIEDEVRVLHNDMGDYTTPSWVAFLPEGPNVGLYAKEHLLHDPSSTVYDIKRIIGRKYSDEQVQEDIKHWPFEVVPDEDRVKVNIVQESKKKSFFPEEISAFILQKMKKIAEEALSVNKIIDAVVTVPAYFNNKQREATKDAAEIAGLNVLQLLNEPTAGAIAYRLDKSNVNKKILVFDLGGGTFDVSILQVTKDGQRVKAVKGNNHLGGEDFDRALAKHLLQEFMEKKHVNLVDDQKVFQRLKDKSEKAKRVLSNRKEAMIQIDNLYKTENFVTKVSRATFEAINEDIFKSTIPYVKEALTDANLGKDDIDEIVLVGGSTRIPKIQSLIQDFFGKKKKINKSINPDEAVAQGAALFANQLYAEACRRVPRDSLLMSDVTPISLGVGTVGELMSVIVPRNSEIPIDFKRIYTNAEDNQEAVTVEVYEGERELLEHNEKLASFHLMIPKAPAQTLDIEVSFKLDNSGILHVTAVETSSGVEKEVKVTNDTGKERKDKIRKMIATARLYRSEDRRSRRAADARNDLENKIYKIVKKCGSEEVIKHISDVTLTKIKKECEDTVHWLKSVKDSTYEEVKQKKKMIEEICQPVLLHMKSESRC